MQSKSIIGTLLLSLAIGGGVVLLVSQIVKTKEPAPEVLTYDFKIVQSMS